jgi:hypothetical protein
VTERELPLGAKAAAKRAGMPWGTWKSRRSRGLTPEPDGWIDRRTPVWWPDTIDEYGDGQALRAMTEATWVCGAFELVASKREPYRCTELAGHAASHRTTINGEIVAWWPRRPLSES